MKVIYKILTAAVLLISLILINNDIKQREKYIDNAYCIEYKGTVTNKLDCKRYGKLIWSNWYVQIQPYDTKLFNPYLKEVDPFDYGEYNIGDKFSCRMPKKDVTTVSYSLLLMVRFTQTTLRAFGVISDV